MAISESELKEALTRASSLMTLEGQQYIENTKKKLNFDKNGDCITAPSYKRNQYNSAPKCANTNTLNEYSTLPKAIIESIMQNPINDFNMDGSVLDNIDYVSKQKINENNKSYSQPTYEQTIQTQQPMLTIDYNYIRSIVNECVQANLKQIKEEILNESQLKMIRLGNENKIQLIDNKNNLYESKLSFKKNLTKS